MGSSWRCFGVIAYVAVLGACSSPSRLVADGANSDGSGADAPQRVDATIDATIDAAADAAIDASTATEWARHFSSSDDDLLVHAVVGSDRSVVAIGWVGGLLVENGTAVKLDEYGNQLWRRSLPVQALAIDGADDIYLSGPVIGSVDIDGHVVTAPTASTATYLAKLDGATGTAEWVVLLADHWLDMFQDLAVTDDGSAIAVTGSFYSTTIDLGGDVLTNHGADDLVVAVFEGSGVHRWSRNFGNDGSEMPHDIVFTQNGDVIVCGDYSFNPDLGGGPLPGANSRETFLASYAGVDGAHLWSNGFWSPDDSEEFQGLAVDNDALYVVGGFWGSGTSSFGGPPLTPNGNEQGILVRYDATTGAYVWQQVFGGAGVDDLMSVTTAGGQVVFAGVFTQSLQAGSTTLTSNGSFDLAYGYADPATGAYGVVHSAGGNDEDVVNGFAVSGNDAWLAGQYYSDEYTLFGSVIPTAQQLDGFIGRTQL